MLKTKQEIMLAIESKSKRADNGCLEWFGIRSKQGYGMMFFLDRTCTTAHRALYQAIHGLELPRSIVVCHKCDNPSCVDIDHLFAGTHRDNMHDKLMKGRNAKKYKLHTRVCKHSNEKIMAIKNSVGKAKVIAKKFEVSESYVYRLRSNKAKTLL